MIRSCRSLVGHAPGHQLWLRTQIRRILAILHPGQLCIYSNQHQRYERLSSFPFHCQGNKCSGSATCLLPASQASEADWSVPNPPDPCATRHPCETSAWLDPLLARHDDQEYRKYYREHNNLIDIQFDLVMCIAVSGSKARQKYADHSTTAYCINLMCRW